MTKRCNIQQHMKSIAMIESIVIVKIMRDIHVDDD